MSSAITLALWAVDMACAPPDAAAFIQLAGRQIERAASAGATLLVLPEYVSEAWLAYAPPDLPETAEIAWMAAEALHILPALAERAGAANLALLSGTSPAAQKGEPGYRNRAALFLPDGRCVLQDKLCLTPDERDPAAWMVEPGGHLTIVEWAGCRLAIVICLDIEQPALAARLQALDLDLLLVPSDTGQISGHSRVFGCARARATELYCAVAAVGGVGPIPRQPPRPNVSGAAVFLPAEMAFGGTGAMIDTGPRERSCGDGDLVIVEDVPIGRVRNGRRQGSEVWPGPWSAAGIDILTSAVD